MAVHSTTQQSPVGTAILTFSQDYTADTPTAEEFSATSGLKVLAVMIDNRGNSTNSYLKLWDLGAAPTVGSTTPNYVFRASAGTRCQYTIDVGTTFTDEIYGVVVGTTSVASGALTTTTTTPANAVTVKLLVTT
tara:strand:- start:1878 stop:2279 length:402 start_codon:yes stop_codon:yes gene_type:complete